MKEIIISLLFVLFCFQTKSQTTINCSSYKSCWWNMKTNESTSCIDHNEYSIIYINKDETNISITTNEGESNFVVLYKKYLDKEKVYSYLIKQGTSILTLLINYKDKYIWQLYRFENDDYSRTEYVIKNVYRL